MKCVTHWYWERHIDLSRVHHLPLVVARPSGSSAIRREISTLAVHSLSLLSLIFPSLLSPLVLHHFPSFIFTLFCVLCFRILTLSFYPRFRFTYVGLCLFHVLPPPPPASVLPLFTFLPFSVRLSTTLPVYLHILSDRIRCCHRPCSQLVPPNSWSTFVVRKQPISRVPFYPVPPPRSSSVPWCSLVISNPPFYLLSFSVRHSMYAELTVLNVLILRNPLFIALHPGLSITIDNDLSRIGFILNIY